MGTIHRPHGIRGEVKVRAEGIAPEHLLELRALRCRLPRGVTDGDRPLSVASARLAAPWVLLRFVGFDSPEEVAALRGGLLLAERGMLPADEVLSADLPGLEVIDRTGAPRGIVREVLPSVQDLLVVDTPAGERMIPWVDALVEVDLARGRVVVDAIPGLLD